MKNSRRSFYLPFTLGHFANDLVPCSVVVLAPSIALEMGLKPMEVGLLLTLHTLGSALGFFPAGLLADSARNRGNLLMLTFWWVGLGYLLASWAQGFWSLAILFALAGCGDAAWHPLATAILVKSDPQNRGQALGFHAVGGTLSAVIGPVIAGIMLASMDWRKTLHWIILPTLIVGVLFLKIRKLVPEQSHRKVISKEKFQHLWKSWTKKNGLLIICLMSSYHMSLVALISMIPLYLREFHELSSAKTGLAFGMMILSGAFMQPLMGRLSDRVGRRRVIVFGIATSAVCAFFIPFLESLGLLLMIIIFLLVGVGLLEGIRSSLLAAAVEYTGGREGTTLGFAYTLMDGIGAFGALIAGWAAGIQFSHVFVLAGIICTFSLIFCFSVSLSSDNVTHTA
ncbi:MAG: MFS transporter [Deltaproteobacteria bacterium]|nr:MFS transporter [Deltaproteobacteria bacterium]